MNRSPLTLLCLLLAVALLPAARASEPVGERPAIPVFDPLGFIPGDIAEEIAEPLIKVRANDGIDTIVVVIPDFGDTSPEEVAGRFAAAWCDPYAHAIVLFSPGKPGGPWIVPGGSMFKLINRESLDESIANARRRAQMEPTDPGKIRAASVEATDLLRYAKGESRQQSEVISKTWTQKLEAHRENLFRLKIMGLSLAAFALPLLLAFTGFVLFLRGRRPRRFPDISIRQRLGAPYSGGNSIRVNLDTL